MYFPREGNAHGGLAAGMFHDDVCEMDSWVMRE
jgi:hypothetical protein